MKLLRRARSSAAAPPTASKAERSRAAPKAERSTAPVTPSMRPIESPTLWLRPFPLDGGDELRIWEDPRGTLAGGNGATCWDSAVAFATAVSSSENDDNSLASTTDWRGLRVLELGSGCGLVALALACRGAHVVATERAIALPLLAKNVEANAALVERRGGSVVSAALDWTAPDPQVLSRGYDAVVGADLSGAVWKSTSELGCFFTPSSNGGNIASMAWGARNLISTQVLRGERGRRRRAGAGRRRRPAARHPDRNSGAGASREGRDARNVPRGCAATRRADERASRQRRV